MNSTVIRCLVSRAGSIVGLFNMDMVFVSENPHVVFEGKARTDGGEKSVHLVALDPDLLEPLPGLGKITFLYRVPVEDPRSLAPACMPVYS